MYKDKEHRSNYNESLLLRPEVARACVIENIQEPGVFEISDRSGDLAGFAKTMVIPAPEQSKKYISDLHAHVFVYEDDSPDLLLKMVSVTVLAFGKPVGFVDAVVRGIDYAERDFVLWTAEIKEPIGFAGHPARYLDYSHPYEELRRDGFVNRLGDAFAVSPEYRGLGLGHFALSTAISVLKEMNVHALAVDRFNDRTVTYEQRNSPGYFCQSFYAQFLEKEQREALQKLEESVGGPVLGEFAIILKEY
jgi:GNAT superfamily N-acetyltransferase